MTTTSQVKAVWRDFRRVADLVLKNQPWHLCAVWYFLILLAVLWLLILLIAVALPLYVFTRDLEWFSRHSGWLAELREDYFEKRFFTKHNLFDILSK